MDKTVKKSRKKVHNYKFDCGSEIDLNNYSATCTQTNNKKKFYHSYLANMIKKKFNNNFQFFVDNYVSREGKSELVNLNKVKKVEERISNLYTKIRELKVLRDQLEAV